MNFVTPDHAALWTPAERVEDIAMILPLAIKLEALMKQIGAYGIAAPQVGAGVQLFVTKLERIPMVFNPTWTATTDERLSKPESSLTRPRFSTYVARPTSIHARWQNALGEECQGPFEGMDARVFMHLCGYLEGAPIFPRPVTHQLPLGITR